jgi:hypothetical protein
MVLNAFLIHEPVKLQGFSEDRCSVSHCTVKIIAYMNNNNKQTGLLQFWIISEIIDQFECGRTHWMVISQTQGLYLHRTAQHRETSKSARALSGIRSHYSSIQATKSHVFTTRQP